VGLRFGVDPEKGAKAPIYLASSPEVVDISGRYFDEKRIVNSSALSRDKVVQKKFWEISEKLVGIGRELRIG
jgi:retinol dehydrogenase-14